MKPSSAKNKGRTFQQAVMAKLLATFPELEPDDIRSTSMGAGGADLLMSPKAKALIPYEFECKARKSMKTLYDWLDQAKGHGNGEPLVVFKGDRKQPQVILSLDHFLELARNGAKVH